MWGHDDNDTLIGWLVENLWESVNYYFITSGTNFWQHWLNRAFSAFIDQPNCIDHSYHHKASYSDHQQIQTNKHLDQDISWSTINFHSFLVEINRWNSKKERKKKLFFLKGNPNKNPIKFCLTMISWCALVCVARYRLAQLTQAKIYVGQCSEK